MDFIWILILVVYLILAHLIGHHIGRKRKIGYGRSLLWALLFSPLIGFLITYHT